MNVPRFTGPAATGQADVERVAETHFFIRHRLQRSLESWQLDSGARDVFGTNAESYWGVWTAGYGDRFFDMATFIRLGTAVENGLRHFHREVSGKRIDDHGVFQRLVKPDVLGRLFVEDCGVGLEALASFAEMREVMVHRHLFAHRAGLVDDKYVSDLKAVTGQDISHDLAALGFPDEDVYWFTPLRRLGPSSTDAGLIEAARRFFRDVAHLPVG